MVLFGKAKELHMFKMADVYHASWSKFPSQSEASIRFLVRDEVCFSTSLLNLMYSSIFVRVAKNLALYPRFMLSIKHVSIVVHNLWKKCIRYFYSQCAFNNVDHVWLMSSSRCWDGRWCPWKQNFKVMSPLWQDRAFKYPRPRNRYDSSCYTTPQFSNAKFIYTWNMH